MNDNIGTAISQESPTQRLADKTDGIISSPRSAAYGAVDSLRDKASAVANLAPSRVAAQVDKLSRAGIERTKAAAEAIREQAARANERTVLRIKDEPLKSVIVAVLAGAAVAALIGHISGRKHV